MSAQGGAASRAPRSLPTTSALDYGWWASNGPTGGYLARRALDAVEQSGQLDGRQVRHVHVQVLRLAAADAIDIDVTMTGPSSGVAAAAVTFRQHSEFAIASVTLGPGRGNSERGDAAPPPAFPRDTYPPMATPSSTLPPVTGQFEYRPAVDAEGRGPRPGWDVVWITPIDPSLRGQALIASVIDSWYPPSFMRSVRDHLHTGQPLGQPGPLVLITAGVSFPADVASYQQARHVLLANQLSATVDGYYFERSEVWSEHGELLATADLVRTEQWPTP